MNLPPAPTMSGSSTAKQFQLLICQSLLGLPVEPLLDNHPHFRLWFSQIQQKHHSIWDLPESQKATDYRLQLEKSGKHLSTTLDLILDTSTEALPDSAEIFRWDTREPQLGRELIHDQQIRLDLYLVVEKLGYQAAQVSYHHWFLGKDKAISVSLSYSAHLHEQFSASLDSEIDYTQLFLEKKISRSEYQQYIETIPEIEI